MTPSSISNASAGVSGILSGRIAISILQPPFFTNSRLRDDSSVSSRQYPFSSSKAT